VGDAAAAYKKGRLKFELAGEKLRGGWNLVRTHGGKYAGGGKEAWLLIKENDDFARRGVDARIVDSQPESVASGRSIEEIAKDPRTYGNRTGRSPRTSRAARWRRLPRRRSRRRQRRQRGHMRPLQSPPNPPESRRRRSRAQ
jgi:bifunctional non-homologous end joining protein LigD